MKIVIVGGGIAGLATAYYLRNYRPTLIESRDRLGGVIATETEEGYLIEGGPDSFVTFKPWARQLCDELGLELIPMRRRGASLLVGGELRRLPDGFMNPAVWLKSGLISLPGKLRMIVGGLLGGPSEEDESVGAYVRRRLGSEMVEKFADPLLGGIYMAPADRLSLQATFPNLGRGAPAPSDGSPFVAVRGGMARLVEALRVPEVEVRTGTTVDSLGDIDADRIVLATPAHVTAKLLGIEIPVPYVSSSTVSLGFAGVTLPEGTGFVIARGEQRRITACSFSSQKFEGRAPEGHALIRCFFHGQGSVEVAREELRDILGITAEPVVAKVFDWPSANPVYEVGHLDRIAEIEARLPKRVRVTGSGFRGVGIPDCIRDAARVAGGIE